LRNHRYGIDDLGLYKALDLAGLEGRVVVVDTMQFADAVLTTRSKRTGKGVNLAEARRAAQGAGVPLFVLRAVSAQRVLEALAPMLGLEQQPQQQLDAAGIADGQREGLRVELQGSSSSSLGREPRLLRWDEVEGDGSDDLLQLLWGSTGRSRGSSSSSTASKQETAVAVDSSPRWLAWHAAQQQRQQQQQSEPGDGSTIVRPHTAPGVLPGVSAVVVECIRTADVEDAREALVPANPTQRAGERYLLRKPLRHNSRLRRRRLQRELWLKQVPW
jgi:ribosomal protein L24E